MGKKEEKKGKRYSGRIPGQDWGVPRDIGEWDGAEWVLYQREGGGGWTNFRVSARGMVGFKANYRLGWNGERWARGEDQLVIEEHAPELLALVEQVVCDAK